MKSIKQFVLMTALTAGGLLLLNAFGANVAFGQALDATQDSIPIVSQLSGGQTSLRGIILTVVNFFLTFLGLLTVVMVIYGGFLYVSSAGNEDNVGKAKKILLYSVIGIVIIVASFAFVNTILQVGTTTGQ